MADLDKAFEVQDGLLFAETRAGIVSGNDDPTTGGGQEALTGSFFLRTVGEAYLKTGTADTDWTKILNDGDISISVTPPAAGLTITGGPITGTGTFVFALANDLAALEGLGGTGFPARTSADTWAQRELTAGAGISVTNGDGVAGNPTIAAAVTSVFGRAGAVVAAAGDYSLDLLSDVALSAPQVDQILLFDGTAWVNVFPPLAATAASTFRYRASNTVTPAGIATGTVRWNDATQGDATVIYIHHTTQSYGPVPATNLTNFYRELRPGNVIFLQDNLDAAIYQRWEITSTNEEATYFEFGVALLDANGGNIPNDNNMIVALAFAGSNATVSSVDVSGGTTGLTFTGGPIVTSGTITLGGTLGATSGGTDQGTYVAGDILYAPAADALARLPIGSAGQVLTVVGGLPEWATSAGGGTVTSVALTVPPFLSVAGSPITTAGTLAVTLTTQAASTVLAGPASGPAAAPTFRALGLGELSDVVLTSPTVNQVIAYDGANWVNTGAVGANATGLVGVGQPGAAAWSLVSGATYQADFEHNLGTSNVVVTVWNTANEQVVIPNNIINVSANVVRIRVVGNTTTLRVVVVANGQSIVAGGSTPASVITAKNGVDVLTGSTRLNFTGQAVNVIDAGGGTATVMVGSRFSYFANSLDSPNNADFAVNALAAVITDPTYPALNVRSFSHTVEQGVGCTVSIPPGATQVTFKWRGRPSAAPGVASVVQPRLYYRRLPNNAVVSAWSAPQELANISIPTNSNFQYATQTVTLASLGLVADSLYQFELTRRVTGVSGTNLANEFLLAEVTIEFS